MGARAASGGGRGLASDRRDSGLLGLAVVGLGYWGPNLVRCVNALPDATLHIVCDTRQERLDLVTRTYPAVRTTASIEDVLDDHAVDAVVLATPISTHYPLARACIEAGKHVLVEKPLALTSEHAEHLVALAGAHERVLLPGHTFLYSAPVNTVRQLIESGDLGEIFVVSMSRVNLGLHQSDTSVLWDLAPHDFSILRYWFDEVPIEYMTLARDCVFSGTPDVAFVNMRYESGLIAHVELAWLAPSKLRRTTVIGSRKMAVYDDTNSVEPVRVFDAGVDLHDPATFGEFQLSYRTGDIVSPRIDVVEPLAAELADFCRAIREGTEPRSSSLLGLDVVRMIEGAEAALRRPSTEAAASTLQGGLGEAVRATRRASRRATRATAERPDAPGDPVVPGPGSAG